MSYFNASARKCSVAKPILYFDGKCPVCAREIDMYRHALGADQVCWIDVSVCTDAELGDDLVRGDALARLHLRMPDGALVHSEAAFAQLWQLLPQWAWLGRLAGTMAGQWVLGASYRLFLRVRTLWRPKQLSRMGPPSGQAHHST